MVLTRSQRTPGRVSKSVLSSGESVEDGDHESRVPKFQRKRTKPKPTPSPAESNVKPLPDSTTPPDNTKYLVRGKDAVAMTTNDEVDESDYGQPVKGKQSKKRNRKRKLTVENESKAGNLSETGVTTDSSISFSISSSTSSPDYSEHQKAVGEQDTSREKPKLTSFSEISVINDEQQKENVNTTAKEFEAEDVEEEKLEAMIQPVKVLRLYKKESYVKGQPDKPKGQPKSGRYWKTEQTTRFSGMKQDRPLRTSWKKKMQQKAEMKNLKTFEAELKMAKSDELERKKKGRARKIKKKEENQRKSEIVQVVLNPAKIKRMKKKQLRKIEMRSMPDSSKKQVFTS